MSTVAATYTIAEFLESFGLREGEQWELVRGVPQMSPSESLRNVAVRSTLFTALTSVVDDVTRLVTTVDVHLFGPAETATVRQPDLAVLVRGLDLDIDMLRAQDVALVVEVVSPSSGSRDRVTKSIEYARAGIPAYLLVDPRQTPALTLRTSPTERGYAHEVSGGRVTVTVDGRHVELDAARLLP